MNIKRLWELPILSQELEGGIKIDYNGLDMSLGIQYPNPNKENSLISITIKFETVLCHMHTSECFTKELFNSYDALVEINDSDWLSELKRLNAIDYAVWKPSHYAIYFDSEGLYQFIARGYQIIEEEVI